MIDGQDGCRDEPGQAEHGADDDQDGHDEQIKMVAASFLSTNIKLYHFALFT